MGNMLALAMDNDSSVVTRPCSTKGLVIGMLAYILYNINLSFVDILLYLNLLDRLSQFLLFSGVNAQKCLVYLIYARVHQLFSC